MRLSTEQNESGIARRLLVLHVRYSVGGGWRSLDLKVRVVAGLLGSPAVDHERHVVDGDGRLGDVGGQYNLPRATGRGGKQAEDQAERKQPRELCPGQSRARKARARRGKRAHERSISITRQSTASNLLKRAFQDIISDRKKQILIPGKEGRRLHG